MKKLDYDQLTRLQTHINKKLREPLLLVKFLTDRTISEIASVALEQYLGCELEIIYSQMNPNSAFKNQIRQYLIDFGRL